jgi:hypothetical protein
MSIDGLGNHMKASAAPQGRERSERSPLGSSWRGDREAADVVVGDQVGDQA